MYIACCSLELACGVGSFELVSKRCEYPPFYRAREVLYMGAGTRQVVPAYNILLCRAYVLGDLLEYRRVDSSSLAEVGRAEGLP